MPIPTWTPAEVLVSDDVNQWFVPLFALKPSDQSVTSSTTLVNDNALVLTPRVNCSYKFTAYIDYEGGAGGSADLKWSFTFPAGAQIRVALIGVGSGGGSFVGDTFPLTSGAGSTGRSQGAGTGCAMVMMGTMIMSSTAGSLQFQFAQNTSNGVATTIHAKSWIELARVA